VIIFFNTPDNILYLLITFGFLYGIPYGVNATYMAETFSTDVRGTAIGGAYNIGRVGAAIAPATIGFLASGGTFAMAFIVMGAAYFIAGYCLVYLLKIVSTIHKNHKIKNRIKNMMSVLKNKLWVH
jgi:AAHS family cis,cis-muconate transporter-like MFS transporter